MKERKKAESISTKPIAKKTADLTATAAELKASRRIAKRIESFAKACVASIAKPGIRRKFDFTEKSLGVLDKYVKTKWRRGYTEDGDFDEIISLFGAYVGHVMQLHNEGRWSKTGNLWWVFHMSGVTSFPFNWVRKLIESDEDDYDVASCYGTNMDIAQAMGNPRGKRRLGRSVFVVSRDAMQRPLGKSL